MSEEEIRKAYVRIRTIDQTIPDDVLDFMKDCAIEKLHAEPVKPVDNGITVLINKINERIRLIPDDPNLSQRGALDAYLNVISWANDKAIENPTVRPLIQSGVPMVDIKTNLLIGLIEKARTYMGGWVFTQKELISDYKESVINSNPKQVKQPVMQWVKATSKTFENEDWQWGHYRYAKDKAKLEAYVWEVKEGYLQKLGGTGTLPFCEIELLEEPPIQ